MKAAVNGRSSKLRLLNREKPVLPEEPDPEMICYRGQTLSIVRHFFEISSQLGRLPSILGREFFRARVSHHAIPSFEDQALFAHDVEKALRRLGAGQREIITIVGLYDVSQQEAAVMLDRSEGWVSQRFSQALASLTAIFLEMGLIKRSEPDRKQSQVMGRRVPRAEMGLPPKKGCGSVRTVVTPARRAGAAVVALSGASAG